MNYLAHVLLASHSDAAMVGAMLGDFVKADVGAYPEDIAREIRLHRLIDSYTDRHPEVEAARALFAPGRRRFAGIALDVFFDHALSRQWPQHSAQDKDQLIQRFYRALASHHDLLPERLQLVAPRIIAYDWLGAYAGWEGVQITLTRMAGRLSRSGHLLTECLIDLEQHYDILNASFARFFPDLQSFTEHSRGQTPAPGV